MCSRLGPSSSFAPPHHCSLDTNVEEAVGVDEFTVIPAGSRIRGNVTLATPATRQQSGVIEVVFDRLTLPNGSTFPISGRLTSTDSAERRQIESDPNSRVVLVGERGGIGAAIAGAGSGKSANNIFAALGSMLSEGRDVSVPAGTPLAVQLDNAVTLRGGGRLRGTEASTIYTSADRVRAAQQALARLNYYQGSVNGLLDDDTRNALFQFQVDRGLRGTGNLDGRTAQALGINLGTSAGLSGTILSPNQASAVRRDANWTPRAHTPRAIWISGLPCRHSRTTLPSTNSSSETVAIAMRRWLPAPHYRLQPVVSTPPCRTRVPRRNCRTGGLPSVGRSLQSIQHQ